MREHRVRRIPVVDKQGRCIGVVAQADIVLRDNSDNVHHMLASISTPRTAGIAGSGAAA